MINMLKALEERVDKMYKQLGNFGRDENYETNQM